MKILALFIGLLSILMQYPNLLLAQNLVLEYSTYLGGESGDQGEGIAVDSLFCSYVTGLTSSCDFPVKTSYQETIGSSEDCFITKLDSSGSSLVYSTYLGGNGNDCGYDISVDPECCVYLTGRTGSNDFPAVNAYQTFFAGGDDDSFVVKLDSSGSSLLFSTYLGGDDKDIGYSICHNRNGESYLTGYTRSYDFPTINPFQSSLQSSAFYGPFISRLSASGSELLYSSYLGSNWQGTGIALDSNDQICLVGESTAKDVWIPFWQTTDAVKAGVVIKLTSSGHPVGKDTTFFLTGMMENGCRDIVIGSDDTLYVTGFTNSTDFPVVNAYQAGLAYDPPYKFDLEGKPLENKDAFVTRIASSGSEILFSTYLGGMGEDFGAGIAVTSDNGLCVIGTTDSYDFPVKNPYQARSGGGRDLFISQFSFQDYLLLDSTYLGGSSDEYGSAVCLDSDNRIYATGSTSSQDFPLSNPYQTSSGGQTDIFIARLGYTSPPPPPAEKNYQYDYNGDGTSDITIFRGEAGLWAVRGVTRVYFGASSDIPVPGDYNGDGTTEIGVFRESSGLWALRGVSRVYFGGSSDQLVPGDYNGDGTWEIGIFRTTSGLWGIQEVTRCYFGSGSDLAVPGYFDDDDTLDIALYRPAAGLWAIQGISRIYFGGEADLPRPGDYNGDGIFEAGIFRSSAGLWAIQGVTRQYFGGDTDDPLPADYSGGGTDEIGIYRSGSGLWAISGVTRVYFGNSSDTPVVK